MSPPSSLSGYCSKRRLSQQQAKFKGLPPLSSPMPMPILILQLLSIILSCLVITCRGFQTTSSSYCKTTVRASAKSSSLAMMVVTKSNPVTNGINGRYPLTMAAQRDNSRSNEEIIRNDGIGRCFSSNSYCSSSTPRRLFPQKKRRTGNTMLAMIAENNDASSTNKVSTEDESSSSSSSSSLVKLSLPFRKLRALVLKPFQLMKSLATKDAEVEDLVETTREDDEGAKSEGVAIKEIENIAAVEDIEEDMMVGVVADSKEEELEAAAEVVPSITSGEDAMASVESVTTTVGTTTAPTPATRHRSATTANVDLTGNWTLIVDDTFTSQYENYLRKLGQPMLVRTVAQTVIGSTKEEAVQSEDGKRLFIRGMNVRGSWERTLEASEQTVGDDDIDNNTGEKKHAVEGHELKPMTTADGEDVEVAAWWENNGSSHHSWVVGGKKYGGGDFENKRYLTDNGNILVCESTFHPRNYGENTVGECMKNGEEEKASVTWRFLREGAMYSDEAVEFPNIFDVLKKEEKGQQVKDTEPGAVLIVGDIMDNVGITSDEEAMNKLSPSDDTTIGIHTSDIVEEQIERESWVPPSGDRWAIAAPGVDLSGKWKLITTEQFKTEYDEFLKSLGQPLIVRGAAVVMISNTREETEQSDNGRSLYIKGVNSKGIWERSLISSGSDFDTTMQPDPNDGSYDHAQIPIMTADSERVMAESWWEEDGTVHVSWTRGVKRYGGGSFESKRYLENDGDVYVCESIFHPDNERRGESCLRWKFLREGAALMLTNQQ
mmetsp:Transcript_23385/g.56449  ORF Transcript_23385/g.56449 Transcript_23385/m.56449 type:complete len:775 (+) Transcript_23385:175-2499(+)